MEALFSRPDLPIALQRQEGESVSDYSLFKKWCAAPLENNEVRSQALVLIDKQWFDASNIAAKHNWYQRALAFDVWVSDITPDLMASVLAMAPMLAFKALVELVNAPGAKAGDRVRAAEALLDRTGYARKVEIKRTSDEIDPESLSTAELYKMVKSRASRLGSTNNSGVPAELPAPSNEELKPVNVEDAVYLPVAFQKKPVKVKKEVDLDDL